MDILGFGGGIVVFAGGIVGFGEGVVVAFPSRVSFSETIGGDGGGTFFLLEWGLEDG